MGNLFTRKNKHGEKSKEKECGQKTEQQLTPKEIFDKKALETLRYQLLHSPEEFVLNQLLASFQFFANFEREWSINQNAPQIEKTEATLNVKLTSKNKRVLLPDRLQESVLKRVKYRNEANKENQQEALHPLRTILVHDDIEVCDGTDHDIEYVTVPDTPLYRVAMEAAEHKGFMKLRKIEVLQKQGTPNVSIALNQKERPLQKTLSFSEPNDTNGNIATMRGKNDANTNNSAEKKLVGIIKNVKSIQQTPNQNDAESDYGYTTVTALTTPKPLIDFMGIGLYHNPNINTEYCISKVDVKIVPQNISEVKDVDDIKPLYETKEYLNSIFFAEQFAKAFSVELSEPLGYRNDTVDKAMTRLDAAAIFCRQSAIAHEVIPSIGSKWPYCANEWLIRQRVPMSNSDQTWPTRSMINHVHSLDCQLLPSGHISKRGVNAERHLEWRITFPEAERFLLSTLHHSEVRCYEFLLLLFRKILEPTFSDMDGIAGFVRAHFFWQCEMKAGTWRDDRLGEILLDVLRTFYRRLQKKRLPDYFVRERNLFESIPTERLNLIAGQLHSAIERPTMHFIAALVHLQYRDRSFFPMLNLQKLYTILTKEDIILLVNPHMARDYRTDRQKFGIDMQEINDIDDVQSSITTLKGAVVHNAEDQDQMWSLQARKLIEIAKARTELNKELSKKEQDIINLQMKVQPLTDLRRSLVLDLFISHFIEIAVKCMYYDATKRAIAYLEQAKRLTKLLADDVYRTEEANNYLERISKEEKIAKSIVLSKGGPDLPKPPESSASSESSWRRRSSLIRQEQEIKAISEKANSTKSSSKTSLYQSDIDIAPKTTTPKQSFTSFSPPHVYSFKESPLFKSVK